MAIVSSEIVEQHGQEVRYKFVDHLAVEYYESWQLEAGVDAATFMAQRVTALEDVELPEREVGAQLGAANSLLNPDKVPPDHQSQENFDRRLIGELMTVRDVDVLIASLPFWTAQELRNGNNNVQRAANLGVPTAEYVEADGRFGDLQGVAGGVATVNEQQWGSVKDAWI